jgi:4-amino-4-deoxy-L-arabinose transferase-like glycosyltransferase
LLLVLALCGVLFFHGLTAGQLWRTEGLRALVAANLLHSGNWAVPTLYGEPFFTKPPGMYAAIALFSTLFGGLTEWTARLPSALAATATALLVYWYFGRQLGRRGGLVAVLLLPMSVLWLEKAPSAEIDMLQVAWVTGAVLFFLRALEEEEAGGSRPPAFRWWLASLLCVAGGVLTKWTAPAFFYGMAVPLLWWRGRLRLLLGRRHLVAAGLGAGICLAWAGVAVAREGWDVFATTIANEALQRLSPGHSPRPYPWAATLRHPFKLLVATLPWSAVALLALRPSFATLWDERGRRLLQALHCWVWPNVLFWSLPSDHAARQSFPLFPGITGLAAMVMLAWLTGRLRWPVPRITPAQVLVGATACWLAVKVAYVYASVNGLALHLGPVRVAIPARHRPDGGPRVAGEAIAGAVPPGAVLYIVLLKDEGVMFYYGGEVRRVASVAALPPGPVYLALTGAEWEKWDSSRPARVLRRLYDGQGDPIVLVELPG